LTPDWYTQIIEFLDDHPEFTKLLPIVALDEYPAGFNRNPNENEPYAPTNIFETILYGIGHADSQPEEGKKQYIAMVEHVRTTDVYKNEPVQFPETVIPYKATVASRLIKVLFDKQIPFNELSLDQMDIIEDVEGVTKNTIALVYLIYADKGSESVIPYRDSYFAAGMEMLYGWENATKEQIKEKTDTWKNKKVGVMFIIQYAYYPSYVAEK
jgi:hypothetical protein